MTLLASLHCTHTGVFFRLTQSNNPGYSRSLLWTSPKNVQMNVSCVFAELTNEAATLLATTVY